MLIRLKKIKKKRVKIYSNKCAKYRARTNFGIFFLHNIKYKESSTDIHILSLEVKSWFSDVSEMHYSLFLELNEPSHKYKHVLFKCSIIGYCSRDI